MVYLNYELSFLVDNILKEKGFDRGVNYRDEEFHMFTPDLLKKITSITLNNFTSLEHLDKLPNLKEVIVKSVSFENMTLDVSFDESQYINHIYDFELLESLSNLESLSIINDVNIKKLDISNFRKLKKLVIINNPNLTELKGLDNLKKLEEVIIYGTSINNSIDINKYIENTIKTKKNILDINMYTKIVENNPELSNYITEMYKSKRTKIQFAEQIGFINYVTMSPSDLKEIYDRCIYIINNKNIERLDEYNQIKFVYDYVVRSNKLDEEGMRKRDKIFIRYLKEYGDIPESIKKRFAFLHSSYSACMFNKSNCEGYVNLMKFMLNILGIRSYNIHCTSIDAPNRYVYNHSSIRVLYNKDWYYCEPTWEKVGENKFFMKTKSEFMQTHCLNSLEQQIKEVDLNEKNFRRIIR